MLKRIISVIRQTAILHWPNMCVLHMPMDFVWHTGYKNLFYIYDPLHPYKTCMQLCQEYLLFWHMYVCSSVQDFTLHYNSKGISIWPDSKTIFMTSNRSKWLAGRTSLLFWKWCMLWNVDRKLILDMIYLVCVCVCVHGSTYYCER